MYLYETYNVLSENNIIQTDIPNYITDNLKYPLRPYQKKHWNGICTIKMIIVIKCCLNISFIIWQQVQEKPY